MMKSVAVASWLTAALALVGCGAGDASDGGAHAAAMAPVAAKVPNVPPVQSGTLISAVSYSTVDGRQTVDHRGSSPQYVCFRAELCEPHNRMAMSVFVHASRASHLV